MVCGREERITSRHYGYRIVPKTSALEHTREGCVARKVTLWECTVGAWQGADPILNMQKQSLPKGKKPASRRATAASSMVRAPLAQNRSSRRVSQSSQRYRESERILTVLGSSSFAVQTSVVLNPGIPSSFPWLSGHAALYEKFRVHRVVYRYKNLKGASSDGNILMSFDYDTLDAVPASAVEMTQATRWIDGAPWRIFELAIPCDSIHRFNRKGPVGAADLKTYDIGKLNVAAEGCADSSAHGYLEVEYDIELFDKQPDSVSARPNTIASAWTFGANQALAASGVAQYDEVVSNPLGLTLNAGSFTGFMPGWYHVFIDGYISGGAGQFHLYRNGAPLTQACQCDALAASSTSLNRPIQIDEDDTISVYVTVGGAVTIAQDRNRVTFVSI